MKERGLVIWPADSGAAVVARGLVPAMSGLGIAAEDICLLASAGEGVAELRSAVQRLVEVRLRREVRLVVLAAAGDREAHSFLGLLGPVSRELRRLAADEPAILLVLLVPSNFAGEEERIHAARLIEDLEAQVWEQPLLRICFLNTAGTRTFESSHHEGTSDADLLNLLCRELADEALRPFVESIGPSHLELRAQWNGRKCCFSTLGAVTLVYPRPACLRFLGARLTNRVFEVGLCDRAGLPKRVTDALQARADAFIDLQTRELGDRLPPAPIVALEVLRHHGAAGEWEERMAKATSEINRAIGRPLPNDLAEAVVGRCRQEIEAVLAGSPPSLAAGLAFVEALEGQRLPVDADEDREVTSGVPRFRQALCVAPLVEAVIEVVDPLIDGVLAEVGAAVLPQRENEHKLEWYRRCLENADPGLPGSAKGARLRFLLEVCGQVFEEASAASRSSFLATRVLEAFDREAGPLLGSAEQCREARKALLDEKADLKRRYRLWNRIFGAKAAAYRSERARLTAAFRDQSAVLSSLESGFEVLVDLLAPMLNDAALPCVWKSKLVEALAIDAETAAGSFRDFVEAVEDALPAVDPVSEIRTKTVVTLHTDAKLQALFDYVGNGLAWDEHASQALSFLPNGTADIPYAQCRNLADHYRHGANSLAQRIVDYAGMRVSAVADRHALEILEMDGEIAAKRFVENWALEAGRFLLFDSTSLLGFEQRGKWDVLYVVRTSGGKLSDFALRYGDLFRPSVEFLDSEDPDSIDINCLRFGFPATLLRGFDGRG